MNERGSRFLSSPAERVWRDSVRRFPGIGHVHVGAVLFHGISDRDRAGEQISTQLVAIARAVVQAAGGDPAMISATHDEALAKMKADEAHWAQRVVASREALEKSKYATLWDQAVAPVFNEWDAFYNDRRHWYDSVSQFFTSWDDYQTWFDRVDELRDQVERAGVKMLTPRMKELPRSAGDVVEKAAADVWKMAKIAGYTTLGLGAAFVTVEIVKAAKAK